MREKDPDLPKERLRRHKPFVARPIRNWNPKYTCNREINGLFGIFILIGQLTLPWSTMEQSANQITLLKYSRVNGGGDDDGKM